MKTTATLFEIEDPVAARSFQRVAPVVLEATSDDVTGLAGIALWGDLVDHLGLVAEADRRNLRPIGRVATPAGSATGPSSSSSWPGGDFLSDISLLQDEATRRLRDTHALPSHTTLFRFLAGADLGRVQKAAAINRTMLRRAWAIGGGTGAGDRDLAQQTEPD